MLESQKNIYIQEADLIPDWKSQSKSDLIRGYCTAKSSGDERLANAYTAAVMCKYWGTLTNYCRQPHSSRVRVEDCYDWLTQALIVILNQPHLYNNEYLVLEYKTGERVGEKRVRKNQLYNNPNAPDIAMIKCLHSMKAGFYQAANYDKRKLNYDVNSLESILEDKKDYYLPKNDSSEDSLEDFYYKDMIHSTFESMDYDSAFVLEGVLNGDVFEFSNKTFSYIFNKKKLIKHLRHLDNNYIDIISKEYNLNKNLINSEAQKYPRYSLSKITNIVDNSLLKLKGILSIKLAKVA